MGVTQLRAADDRADRGCDGVWLPPLAARELDLGEIRYGNGSSILATRPRRTPLSDAALPVGDALDRWAVRVLGVTQMAWRFSFELIKPVR